MAGIAARLTIPQSSNRMVIVQDNRICPENDTFTAHAMFIFKGHANELALTFSAPELV
jgi:hypothetical protein